MVERESLICPNTGEQCNFYLFCLGKKHSGPIHPRSLIGAIYSALPEKTGKVMMGKDWCSINRIEALEAIAADPSTTPEEAEQTTKMAEIIDEQRGIYQGTVSARVGANYRLDPPDSTTAELIDN